MKNIIGNRYGKLVVREFHSAKGYSHYYMCDCDCGGKKVVLRGSLIHERTRSCGCLRERGLSKELVGNRYGKLVVREHHSKRGYYHYYMCDCDCGGEKKVLRSSLLSGKTKSCGCLQKRHSQRPPRVRNIVGEQFGKLTVRSFYVKMGKRFFYTCDCECGKSVKVLRQYLISGNTTSCGCLKEDPKEEYPLPWGHFLDRRFGKLVVREFIEKKNNKMYYMCDCDCGGEITVTRNEIFQQKIHSCGCDDVV